MIDVCLFILSRFVGKYEFTKPVVVIRDLELVKKITVKDFEHFLDHRNFMDEINEPLFGKNLFSMKGMVGMTTDQWCGGRKPNETRELWF